MAALDTQLSILVSKDLKDYVSYCAFTAGVGIGEYVRAQLIPFPESPYEKMNLKWVAPDELV